MLFLRMHLCRLFCLAAGLAAASLAAAQTGEEVPFITSPDNVTLEMLRLAQVGPADHVIDLGSGDGRIVILAARRFGATGLGVEIVPDLVQQSSRHAREAGVADRVAFREQDLFKTDLSPATVVTMYLLPEVNLQLRPSLLALKPGTRLVSHDWDLGDWEPDRTTVVPVPDKKVGLERSSKVHLWVVPARVDGFWCGTGNARGTSLQLAQRYQAFDGELRLAQRRQSVQGRIEGSLVRAEGMALDFAGDQLRVGTSAVPGLEVGTVMRRSANSGCDDGGNAMGPHHKISAAQLQLAVSQRFPLRYPLGGLAEVTVATPKLRLLPQQNRLAALVAVEAAGPALRRSQTGTLDLAFALRYERTDQTIRAHQLQLLAVRWPGASAPTAELLEGSLPAVAQQALGEVVLHKLRPQDLALADTMGLEPDTLTVTPEGVTVHFAPKRSR
jgi:SAM-dependent methyltransferase